ncbi:MAG TPA: HNH endonuclease [Verrucomicrobiae bacterium]|nr:HNH endonuclease [Verrucomicrobiae bacterium]
MNPSGGTDSLIRAAAFAWLAGLRDRLGEVLPRKLLQQGFQYDRVRIPLLSAQQGIFKPAALERVPLSIMTTSSNPYRDRFERGVLLYSYQGTNPNHWDNVGLREAMRVNAPLVYFQGILPGRYLATWPVFIVADRRDSLAFVVDIGEADTLRDELRRVVAGDHVPATGDELRREYATREYQQRLHQSRFRERVLDAYRGGCAFCRLRHEALLDAAHIVADNDPGGEPVVENGLALCKLHHAAFDKFFLTLRSDYLIEVRPEILAEEDGPMLVHGLKKLHGEKLNKPRSRRFYPDPVRLDSRYARFRLAIESSPLRDSL